MEGKREGGISEPRKGLHRKEKGEGGEEGSGIKRRRKAGMKEFGGRWEGGSGRVTRHDV